MFVLCYTNILKAHNIITTGNKGGLNYGNTTRDQSKTERTRI
jgi:hypothetical protein